MTIDIGNFSSLQVTHVTRLRVENLALLHSFRLQGRAIELFDFLVCSHQIQVLLFKTADTNAQDDNDVADVDETMQAQHQPQAVNHGHKFAKRRQQRSEASKALT